MGARGRVSGSTFKAVCIREERASSPRKSAPEAQAQVGPGFQVGQGLWREQEFRVDSTVGARHHWKQDWPAGKWIQDKFLFPKLPAGRRGLRREGPYLLLGEEELSGRHTSK